MTIETPYGTTTLDKEPERVVVIGPEDVDSVLALGVTPVAAAGWGDYADPAGDWPPYFGDTTVIAQTLEPVAGGADFEEVLALEPDVIIAVGGVEELEKGYDNLARIAPVVTYPQALESWAVGDPVTTLRTIARPLNKLAEAEALVQEYETKLAGVREAHPEFDGKTFTVVGLIGNAGMWLHSTTGSATDDFFEAMGFVPNPATATVTGEIPEEKFDVVDADVLITMNNNGSTEETIRELRANPLYSELAVVQRGSAVHLDDVEIGVYLAAPLTDPSVPSMIWMLDNLPPVLATAAEAAK
jgi:iron complex transport system substrate-binding protein